MPISACLGGTSNINALDIGQRAVGQGRATAPGIGSQKLLDQATPMPAASGLALAWRWIGRWYSPEQVAAEPALEETARLRRRNLSYHRPPS